MTETVRDWRSSGQPASDRLLANKERIMSQWEQRLREEVPAAATERHPILINTLPALLDYLAQALSPCHPRSGATEGTTIAEEHGGERVRVTQFRLQDLITEYRLLRQVLVAILEEREPLTAEERTVLHTSLDQAMTKACTTYMLVQEGFREQLFAILAHDLRGPLSVVATSLDLIQHESSAKEVARWASRAADSTYRIDRMLQELLDAMRVQAGGRLHLDLVACDLMDIVREAVEELRATHGDRFVVVGQESIRGHFAPDALRRAIENLGNNAVKYGDASRPVTITASEVHGRAVITVHNDGSYIPAEQQETLFRAFHRSQTAEHGAKPGWGLGLAQVRGVAEAHGGSIGIDSLPTSGTTFVIDIPVDARPLQGKPTTP
jgi:signal transduction histidine kinase